MAATTATTTTARRAAAPLVAALVATLLPLVVGASSPAAAALCTDETHEGSALLGYTGCDDTTAPETTIATVTPAPNALGYVRSKALTFSFSGSYTDADTGPIAYECQLYDTVEAPVAWTTCTSPKTYTGLTDTTATPYTFRARAIDSNDAAISACDATAEPLDPTCADEEPLAPGDDDLDATPASVAVHIDTTAPNTFLDREPVDRIRPDWPVVLTATPVLEVNSNEPGGFTCTVNGRALTPCGTGPVALRNLAPGDNTFVARAVDRGGNLDPTPVTTTFFLPSNIKRSKGSGWSTVRDPGLFGDDYVEATKVGQVLVIRRITKVREVRLIAPVGPRYGKIEVRVGTSQWYTVDLHARTERIAQLLVRDEYTTARSGTIQIRVKELKGRRSSVRLDALVARG